MAGLNLDLNNDASFIKSLEENQNGGSDYIDTKELEWVQSGMYSAEISSALISTITRNGVAEEVIRCTFVAYSKTNEVLGKFTGSFDLNKTSKFFRNTLELCYITGNDKGLEETEIRNKDGQVVVDKNNQPLRTYRALCNKRIYVAVMRKDDYVSPNGTVYANYAIHGLYNANKQTCLEQIKGLPATQINKDWLRLQGKIKEQESAQQAREKLMHNTMPQPSPYGNGGQYQQYGQPQVQPQPQYGTQPQYGSQPKPQTPPQSQAFDDIPF